MHPGDNVGSLSNTTDDGKRELFLFACARNDIYSLIYRSGLGANVEVGKLQRLVFTDPSKLELVKRLAKGESHTELVKTDNSPQRRLIKFTLCDIILI